MFDVCTKAVAKSTNQESLGFPDNMTMFIYWLRQTMDDQDHNTNTIQYVHLQMYKRMYKQGEGFEKSKFQRLKTELVPQ